ncbi:MAG: site-2 protease family protein [Chloroflexi bacterium]|nr:site-2 protease family protein [Chloroflexota bacterium]
MVQETTTSQDVAARLKAVLMGVMEIEDTTLGRAEEFAARFRGRLLIDSVEAYRRVSEAFHWLDHTALFRREGEADVILAMRGTIPVRESQAWVNALLFTLTVLSALITGGMLDYQGEVNSLREFFAVAIQQMPHGLPFALAILGILGTHELGHYFAARYHKVAVTLPYFLPLPYPLSPFGTLGAFIALKAPPTNKRVLLDIGLAGPLAGFIVAVPVLLYGLSISPLTPFPPSGPYMLEGNSILYAAAKFFVFGKFLPGGGHDVLLGQVAWAGWAGLLVTGLNLIPAGQLDGGHLLYVLTGKRVMRILLPVLVGILAVLGIFFWQGWLLWAVLLMVLGRRYAEPLDQITTLDPTRRALALLGLIIFVLVFTPFPLRQFGP